MSTNAKRTLLHICCAPDATVPWPSLIDEGYEVTGFFYGNNIHPQTEWEKRCDAVASLARSLDAGFFVLPYDPAQWFGCTESLKCEPERGARCARCFELQLLAAAEKAVEGGFDCLCTTLTISPHKDPVLINDIGETVSGRAGVAWLDRVWRKKGGFALSVRRSRELGLYRQNYCGCAYSIGKYEESAHEEG